MGYRQTELSPSLSRHRGRLALSPRVRDRPADIASLSPSIPFASALSPFASRSLAPRSELSSGARSELSSGARPWPLLLGLRPSPFFHPVGLLSSLRLFMDLPRLADRLSLVGSPGAFSFTFSLPDAEEKVRAPFSRGGRATDRLLCSRLLNYSRSIGWHREVTAFDTLPSLVVTFAAWEPRSIILRTHYRIRVKSR